MITGPRNGYPAAMHPYEPGESEDPLTFGDDSYQADPSAARPAETEIDFVDGGSRSDDDRSDAELAGEHNQTSFGGEASRPD